MRPDVTALEKEFGQIVAVDDQKEVLALLGDVFRARGRTFQPFSEGESALACSLLAEALPLFRDLGDRNQLITHVSRFALAHANNGSPMLAAQLLAAAQVFRAEVGDRLGWVDRLNDSAMRIIHVQLDEITFAEGTAHGQALTLDEAFTLALNPPHEPA